MREGGRASGRYYFGYNKHHWNHNNHDAADNVGHGKHTITSTVQRNNA
jgi:hypothetical protein